MRQVIIKSGRIQTIDVPPPLIEPGCLLVAVHYSLISTGTEVAILNEEKGGLLERALRQPEKIKKLADYLSRQGIQRTISKIQDTQNRSSALGYACSGVVVQAGPGVTKYQPGDRVACAGAGKANHAEWVLVPQNLTVAVPDGVSLQEAASTTLGAIAMQGVRRADLRLGEWACVIGLGLLGQITAQILNSAGVSVIGVDIHPERLERAAACGIRHTLLAQDIENAATIPQWTEGHGVDGTILTASAPGNELINQAARITRERGRIVVVGAVGMGLDRSPFYEKEQDLRIARSYGPGRYDPQYEERGLDYPYAYVRWTENRNMGAYLRLLEQGRVRFSVLLDEVYPLEKAEDAYRALQQPSPPLAALLAYPAAGQDQPAPPARAEKKAVRAANGKIRVALVGAGGFARAVHLPNLMQLKDSYHLRAVVCRTGISADQAAEQFGADYASTDYAQVLADEDVDLVMICSRHNLHASQTIVAARAGKAVFLEKPLALHPQELEDVIQALSETGVPFTVGFNRRFSPAVTRAQEILSGRTNPLMILYRVNAGAIPLQNWVHGAEGGGRIIGEACHMLDTCKALVGSAPAAALDAMPIVTPSEHISAAENSVITVRYQDGSVASIFYSALGDAGLPKESIEIYAGGMILVIDDFRSLKVFGSSARGWSGAVQDKGHLQELKALAGCVRTQGDGIIPLEDLVETTRLSFAAAGIGS